MNELLRKSKEEPDAELTPLKHQNDMKTINDAAKTNFDKFDDIIEPQLVSIGSQTDYSSSNTADGLYREWLSAKDLETIQLLTFDGEWEPLVDPKEHDVIQVREQLISDDTNISVSLQPGLRGYITKVDQDGDINVFAPAWLNMDCHSGFLIDGYAKTV